MNSSTSQRQLFTPLREFRAFDYCAFGKLHTRDASNTPFITWPDGSPCTLANLYMLDLLDRPGRRGIGLSRRGQKGGSMGDYASKISHLIRYCYDSKRDFIQINDNFFSAFISHLRKDGAPSLPKRTERTVIFIGKVCLNFLIFVGRFYNDNNFVSRQGSIRATEETHTLISRSGKIVVRKYLHHHSFSSGGEIRKRNPITNSAVHRLRKAIDETNTSRHIQSRRHVLLSLLEHTGARRGEIGSIRTDDIRRAYNMSQPMLRLETWKSPETSERYIPVSKMVLNDVIKYIDFHRRKSVKKLATDHGYLFVSECTGKKMAPESITNEVGTLRKLANISEKASPHMFRHAFITNLFALLIDRHKLSNSDEFNRHLLDTPHFVAEIMQWTGHLDPLSVQRYINLAFAKTSNLSETISSVHLIRILEIYDEKSHDLLSRLQGGLSIDEYVASFEELLNLRNYDLKTTRWQSTVE